MKRFLLAIALLLGSLTLTANAQYQNLSEGSVVSLQNFPNPVTGKFNYDFELCCGIPGGPGGYLGNGFAIHDGTVTLFYKLPKATQGFYFTGEVDIWNYPVAIDKNCVIQTGTFKNGLLSYGTKVLGTNFRAEFTQTFCQLDGEGWDGPGGLQVHQ